MSNNKLTGNTATLVLSNCHSLTILVNNSGDGVQYQYNGGNDETIYESEIEYLEDTENVTGYADNEENNIQPAFKTESGQIYFIGEFMRDNYGR
jgi:hypothetical protein